MKLPIDYFLPGQEPAPVTIEIPFGLIGLTELRRFELAPIEGSWPFLNLRSVDGAEVEFLVIEGQSVVADYLVEVSDDDAATLHLEVAEDALVLNIVTVHSMTPQFVTVNLAGPLVVHRESRRGKQVVLLTGERHATGHVLIDERHPAAERQAI